LLLLLCSLTIHGKRLLVSTTAVRCVLVESPHHLHRHFYVSSSFSLIVIEPKKAVLHDDDDDDDERWWRKKTKEKNKGRR
jgi:hypothetical protein